jgi:hypothetical protein
MRLIVLSKTHALGSLPRMRFVTLPDYDVFSGSALKLWVKPGKPFFHDVKPAWPEPGGNSVIFH